MMAKDEIFESAIRTRTPSAVSTLFALLFLPLQVLQAAEITGYAVFTTDYVWRGITQSDGDPALQLGAEIGFESGIYAGAWASTVDIASGPDRQRDHELNLYLGYGHELDEHWVLGAAVVSYNYPGQTGTIDYDYFEYHLTAGYRDMLWLQYAYSPDLYDTGSESHDAELYAEWAVGKSLIAGAGIGYYDVSRLSGSGYSYWELGITWPVNRFEFDLRYHDSNRWVPFVSSPDRDGPRTALSVRLTF